VVLADGGKAISDIETLRRRNGALLGRAASEPTAWRTIEAVVADELAMTRLFDAVATTAPSGWLRQCRGGTASCAANAPSFKPGGTRRNQGAFSLRWDR